MVKFENISKIYPPNSVALDDVSFEVEEKEFISLVGKSGAGKTTLLKMLLVEEKPTTGQVFFDGKDVHKIKPAKLPELRRKIGAVFQGL